MLGFCSNSGGSVAAPAKLAQKNMAAREMEVRKGDASWSGLTASVKSHYHRRTPGNLSRRTHRIDQHFIEGALSIPLQVQGYVLIPQRLEDRREPSRGLQIQRPGQL